MSRSPALPEELLLDYAAGNASPALSLLMATHVSMSSDGQDLLTLLEGIGGVLLETLDAEPLERVSAMSVLDKADAGDPAIPLRPRSTIPDAQEPPAAKKPVIADRSVLGPSAHIDEALPRPLRAQTAALTSPEGWQTLGWGVAAAGLPVSTMGDRAHLLWARSGTRIANHRHVGREVVLVLKGAFLDDGIRYGPGDVAIGEDGTVHAPRIDGGDECLCLAVTEAPVHFVGPAGWALNRFCRF